nr:MAG TPA: G-protein coupled receptor [Caudoviricetes sp.]
MDSIGDRITLFFHKIMCLLSICWWPYFFVKYAILLFTVYA